jgi:cytosine permease
MQNNLDVQEELKAFPSRIGSKNAEREDYALSPVPATWRYSWSSLIFSMLGGGTAAVFLALPAQLAGEFGLTNVLLGMFCAMVLQTLLNYALVKTASRTGLGSAFMSRGLALGFGGSAWTQIIYGTTWLIFFATEGQVLGDSITAAFGIPSWVSYCIVGAAFIPLVLYGIGFMARFQKWTLYIYIVGMIALLWQVFTTPHIGSIIANEISSTGTNFGGIAFLGVMAAYAGLIGNVALGHADIARLGATDKTLLKGGKNGPLWLSLIPYSLAAYIIFGCFGLLFWLVTRDTNPGSNFVHLLGVIGFLLIIVTQLRINLINAYSGSIALSNFFARYKFLPGRSTWAIIVVIVGTIMMFGDILGNLGQVLTFQGVFLTAWLGVILADLLINRKLFGFGPKNGRFIEYRRALVKNWNYVGLLPMIGSAVIGSILVFAGANGKLGGHMTQYLASLITFVLAVTGTILLGLKDRGKSYSQRQPVEWTRDDIVVECPIDHEIVSTEDMVPCPYHKKWICSTDCMATRDCGEICTVVDQKSLSEIPLPERTPSLKKINEQLKKSSYQNK